VLSAFLEMVLLVLTTHSLPPNFNTFRNPNFYLLVIHRK